MSGYRGRFAPSPTGPLHFGSLISALASCLRARSQGGVWLVRIEDLDPPREVAGAAEHILAQLQAHGMESDEPVLYQSTRGEAYRAVVAALLEQGAAFPCGCTRRDLGDDGVYPGTCEGGLPDGRQPRSVRLRVPDRTIRFVDGNLGSHEENLAHSTGAFVIRRADGLHAYQLAVAVDDAYQCITEVVRGSDLLDSTARQIFLRQTLGFQDWDFLHHPVVLGPDGRKLSKQLGSSPVDSAAPLPALLAAWSFLGQRRPPRPATRSLTAFWDWAVEEWSTKQVPATSALPLPQPGD